VDGATGKSLPAVAKSGSLEKDPTWAADGTHVAYTADNRLFLADISKPGQSPTPLSAAGESFADPAFAPTPDAQVLAAAKLNSPANRNDTDLCIGRVTPDGYQPQCIVDKRFGVGNAHWSPDGRSILVPAVGDKGFGIVRYRSSVPFSARASDWGKGHFVTPLDPDGRVGVIDAAISPDGKHLAAVANLDTSEFRLYLTKPDDLRLDKAKALPVQACKVAWRADSQEIVIVQSGALCDQATGQLSRIDIAQPTRAVALSADGDNPAFQPLLLGK
jgi:hypothetical protein